MNLLTGFRSCVYPYKHVPVRLVNAPVGCGRGAVRVEVCGRRWSHVGGLLVQQFRL